MKGGGKIGGGRRCRADRNREKNSPDEGGHVYTGILGGGERGLVWSLHRSKK